MTSGTLVPRVLLDITPVTARPESRTGLARVALSLGLTLAARDDVEIATCAWGSLIATDDFTSVRAQFPELHGLQVRRSAWDRYCTRRLREPAVKHPLARAMWRLAGQATNRLRNPLAGVDLSQFDLTHSTYARVPDVVRRRRLPTVITVHDVMPLRLPAGSLPPGQVGITSRILRSIRPDDRVACVSEWTRSEFLDCTNHPAEHAVVIPNGVDHAAFHPHTPAEEITAVRLRFSLGDGPYLLTLSSLATHKNLHVLLEAWKRVCDAEHSGSLVLAGGRTKDPGVVMKSLGVDGVPDGVVLTGFVTDAEFRALAAGAQAFLFPSLYEGFGLPVLEAMACGTPVIASSRTSVPEVVGDAGQLLDPMRTDDWACAMTAAVAARIRTKADAACVRQAERFSWSQVADRYAQLYRQVLS
jgi:glycosyltransferase involved in cell wall biosynthesis